MEQKYCSEHTKLISLMGEIKAVADMTRIDIRRLDDRINGQINSMAQHISEGDSYRHKIIRNESGVWWMRVFFVALLVPMLVLLVKSFA